MPRMIIFDLVEFAFICLVLISQSLFGATGAISGSPNPCSIPSGQINCTSTITWSSQSTTQVQVWISHNGLPETNYATSGTGGPFSQAATWIQAGHSYVFSLYDYSTGSRGSKLSSVSVTGTNAPPPATGTLSFQPPVQCSILIGYSTCSVSVTWSSQNTTQVQVWVSQNGLPETNYATSGTGGPFSQVAPWILGGNYYSFRLYSYTGGVRGSLLAMPPAYTGVPCTFE
jgi:hypothetical protein